MKNFKLFGVIIFAMSWMMFSCEDDDDGLDVQNHEKNKFAMIMDTMLTEMMTMQMTGDANYDFAKMMMMHHEGAVKMSQELLNSGGADSIRKIAQEIITKQQAENAELMAFTSSYTPVSTPEGALFDKESMVNNQKLDKATDLEILLGDNNYDYAKLIILHHQGAIDMAQSVLHHGSHPMILEMAKMTIEDQNKEILMLQNWLLNNKPYK